MYLALFANLLSNSLHDLFHQASLRFTKNSLPMRGMIVPHFTLLVSSSCSLDKVGWIWLMASKASSIGDLFSLYTVRLNEWRNTTKIFPIYDNTFHVYLMRGLQKYAKKKIQSGFLLKSTLSVLICTRTGPINLKIFSGYNINY